MEQLEYICPPIYRSVRSLHQMVCESPLREITKVVEWVRKAAQNHPFVTAVAAAFVSCTLGLPFLLVLSFVLLCVLIGAVLSLVFLLNVLFAVSISTLPVLLILFSARVGMAAIRFATVLFPESWVKTVERIPLVAPLLRVYVEILQWICQFTAPTCEMLAAVRRRAPRNPCSSTDNSSVDDSVERLDPEQDSNTKEVVRWIRRKRDTDGSSRRHVFLKTAREFIRYGNPLQLRNAASASHDTPTCSLTCPALPTEKPGTGLAVVSKSAQSNNVQLHLTCSQPSAPIKSVYISSCFTHSITIPSPAAKQVEQ